MTYKPLTREQMAWRAAQDLPEGAYVNLGIGIPTLAASYVPKGREVIFHSDRGSEYMGAPFCATVARLGMRQSANAKGPGDNAHAESFFHSLKAELTRGATFLTERALRTALTASMGYYNTIRLHSGLAYLSPLAFERRVA